MVKVNVYAADAGGCGFYRMLEPARVLAAEGFDVTAFPVGADGHLEAATFGNREAILTSIPECDVVVLQRPLHWTRPQVIRQLQRAGIRVVIDIDDDVHSIQRSHGAYWSVHPRYSPLHNWDICAEAMALADVVTVSTAALAERYGIGRPGRCRIIPNYIPSRFFLDAPPAFDDKTDPSQIVIGWSGRTDTHPGDLDVTDQAVGRLQRRYGFQFRVIGRPHGVRRALALNRDPLLHPWAPIEEYPAALSSVDIAICPLDDVPFNHAKSWLKPLEFGARGIPVVASPLPEYLLLDELEPFITFASGRQEWMAALRLLVTSPGERHTRAKRAFEAARHYVLEDNVWPWAEAWGLV